MPSVSTRDVHSPHDAPSHTPLPDLTRVACCCVEFSFPASVYFDVVLDVDSYHEFVPFCSASKVTRVLGPGQIEADLTIGFRIFTEAYTSHIDFERPRSIRIRSIESSVFGHLISTWSFRPNPKDTKQCYVEFDIDFEVNSPVHASAVKLFFTDVAERQIKAFSDRCIKLYKEGRIKADIEPDLVVAPAKVMPKPVEAPAAVAPAAPAAPTALVHPLAAPVARKTATGLPVPSTAFRYPQRPVPGDVPAVSPDVLVSTSSAALLACPVPHLGPRIKFSASEIEKLAVVFKKHAKPVPISASQLRQQQQEVTHTSAISKIAATASAHPDHLYAASADPSAASSELRLDVAGFAALCTDVCMSTGGVFGRFRERATVRTISDVGANGVLTHALFVGDPQLYASSNHLCTDASGSASVPEIENPEAIVSPRRVAADGSTSSSSASSLDVVAHSFAFGDFLSHFYYLTKATIEEKLLYALVICARRAATQGGHEGYDPSRNRGGSPIPSDLFSAASASAALSIPSLRSATAAFFCAHVGVLRHIMPLMSYHRARELREQIEAHRRSVAQKQLEQAKSPNAALLPPITSDVSAPVEPGVTVLALLGLLEGVLSEAETAVSETIEQMSEQMEQAQEEQHALRTSQQSAVATSAPLSSRLVPLEHWVSMWSNQAELLALVSVPGLATLIQINSIVPLEAHQPTKKQL